MEYRFRHLAAGTAALTGVLMLLGVYTAAAGAGLTCAQRWPLCDGAVYGLFPADWLSFVEWFHRLVAMVTGFVILGTTVAAWRGGRPRRVRWALAVAVVLLPAQIALGALTVTEYEWLILTAHFITALTIFAGVVLAAAWSYEADRARAARAAAFAAALTPLFAAFTPRLIVLFAPSVQVAYYASGLALFAALVSTAVWVGRESAHTRLAAGAGAAVLFVLLVAGRQHGAWTWEVAVGGTVAAFALAGAAAVLARRESAGAAARASGAGD